MSTHWDRLCRKHLLRCPHTGTGSAGSISSDIHTRGQALQEASPQMSTHGTGSAGSISDVHTRGQALQAASPQMSTHGDKLCRKHLRCPHTGTGSAGSISSDVHTRGQALHLASPQMKNTVLWNVTPCDSCKIRRFGGI
jgi:hypothetical protein